MTSTKDIALILHGARADHPPLRHLVDWVREKGHKVRVRVTWEKGDGEMLAREAAGAGVDAVVAVGGDGTVNEVINGLDGSDVPFGIVPIGTANDFAKQVGIPLDPDHAMDVILQREPIRIDTASLNGRRFINVSSGGVGAEATAETPSEAKEMLGMLAYAITGVRKLVDLTPHRATFRADGFELTTEFLLFAVGNGRTTGGGTMIVPRASVIDHLLDVCIVEAMPRTDFAKLVLRIRNGDHVGNEGVHYLQTRSLDVTAGESIHVNVDGEPSDARRLEYRVRDCDLQMYLPHLPGEEEE